MPPCPCACSLAQLIPLSAPDRLGAAGEHTRSIALATPSLAAGGIMRFAKVRLACLGCRAPLPADSTDLCEHCRPKVRAGTACISFCSA